MRARVIRSWLLLLLGCAGCSSLNPALQVTAAKPAAARPTPPEKHARLSLDRNDLSRVQPLQALKPEVAELGQKLPQERKDHIYLFFINGLDPYYLANFRGQCQYMKTLGFNNAYCGQMSHTALFRQKIIDVRRDDRQARIVVAGYSTGANNARTLANQLKDEGVRLDLLVYVGGDTIRDEARSRPDNVGHVLNIMGHSSLLIGSDLTLRAEEIKGASNHRIDSIHFKLPTRAETMELLVRHVVELHRSAPGAQAAADGPTLNPR